MVFYDFYEKTNKIRIYAGKWWAPKTENGQRHKSGYTDACCPTGVPSKPRGPLGPIDQYIRTVPAGTSSAC